MSTELSSYEAAIRDLETERKEIEALIEGLQRRIAKAGGPSSNGMSRTDNVNLSDDTFFGLTVADAARKYLSIVKQTKTTAEIAEALLRGGLKSSATDLPSTVRSIIGPREEFMRVNGKWGLSAWYPGAKRGKQTKEESLDASQSKYKEPKKPATAKNNVPLVIKFLGEYPDKSHSVDEIAAAIGATHIQSLRSLLSNMAKTGRIQKGVPHGYRAAGNT